MNISIREGIIYLIKLQFFHFILFVLFVFGKTSLYCHASLVNNNFCFVLFGPHVVVDVEFFFSLGGGQGGGGGGVRVGRCLTRKK